MSEVPEKSPPNGLADQVDVALERIWQGDNATFEQLINTTGDQGPAVHELFRDLVGPGAECPATVGSQLDQYTIIREIGRGGMGVVYEAEQQQPRRRVALKVIRGGEHGDDDDYRVRLFQREVSTLARLRHPRIATIYDAGRTPGGQHFFVMELVGGALLLDHANGRGGEGHNRALSVRERLDLLMMVCDTIHYAHQRGVIHRDLKPTNILVDESGRPKILDFGLAHIVDADTPSSVILTQIGRVIGTLPYMSPEQARGQMDEVDARSDIYTLGLILYEMLTGKLPYVISGNAPVDAVHTICETPPQPLGAVDAALRGDLETIVGKALAKEPERRYGSAAALADDIRRYLNNEPVAARPATAFYQMRMFARRHRAIVGGVLVAVASLLVAVVSISLQTVRVTRERNHALAAERLAEERRAEADEQRAIAEAEADKAQAISEFMRHTLAAVDPSRTLGRDVPFRAFLDLAADRVDAELDGQPDAQAAICDTLGATYHSLGHYDDAEKHLQRALMLREELFGAEHPVTLASLSNLALVYQDRGRLTEAEKCLRRLLDARRRVLGNEHPETILSINNLGWLLQSRGQLEQAEALYRESLELRRRVSGPDDLETLRTTINLAGVLRQRGHLAEADSFSQRALADCRRLLGEEHPLSLYAMNDRVWLLFQRRDLEEAERLGRQALTLLERVVGAEHPHTLYAMNNLGIVLNDLGRPAEAEVLHRRTLDVRRRTLGPEHPATLESMNNLAVSLFAQDMLEEAESIYGQVCDVRRRTLGDRHPETLTALHNRALVLRALGRLDEAERTVREVLAVRRADLGDEHRYTLSSLENLATLCLNTGRYVEAEELLAELYAARRRVNGPDHSETLSAGNNLALSRLYQQHYAEAEPVVRSVLEIRETVDGPLARFTLATLRDWVTVLVGLQRFEEAEPVALDCLKRHEEVEAPDEADLHAALELVIRLYDEWGRPDIAQRYRSRLDAETVAP